MTNKTILITGGTGSWGVELVTQLLQKQPKEIRIFSRNESLQVQMHQKIGDPRLKFIIGDIRDKAELALACSSVDEVYHLAALKHVPICENQPESALKTNIIGTQNVIDAAIENRVRKVMYVSTDKAANPTNTYGMTKAIGEKLIIYANGRSATKFACFRSGNVLGTTGSVVPLFKQQLKEERDLSVTDPRMTRFFLTLEDAVRILLTSMENSLGGEIFVAKMAACRITDLAQVLINHSNSKHIKIRYVGIRSGEKLHETLITESESSRVNDIHDQYFMIMPEDSKDSLGVNVTQICDARRGYHSEDCMMSLKEIEQLLRKGGLIGCNGELC
ncbi:polysaccharide biosynthesis protein [Paenibacillus azoreducens]|uniref:UDP-N-acetylglucosamine 4,6-dehydratase n=1 Tax=Paenibacillus azoreducens TaxID=116718 RepID=A0A919YHA3_9BACL|nr:polysaccharide biosynthesis protein [Paenibacillus azoreducens]GIO50611.1 UDP-N-acetylglucosamine 4,6-dehydratase [Paenibacillus azoreducens]